MKTKNQLAARTTTIRVSALLMAALTLAGGALAQDTVLRPAAGAAFVVKDATGASDRFMVSDAGVVSMPSVYGATSQANALCISTAGALGPCAPNAGFSLPYSGTAATITPLPLFELIQSGTGNIARFQNTSASNAASMVEIVSNGIGGGLSVQLSNAGSGARGIEVANAGVGPGVFATTAGNAIWGITTSISSAGVIGDNSAGEAVVGRATGTGCQGNIGGCAGIGAVVGRHDGPQGIGVRGFVTDPAGGTGVLGQVGISGGVGVAGRFENVNAANTGNVLEVQTNGSGSNLAVFMNGGNVARISNNGAGYFNGGVNTSGADIAELIDTVGTLPQPGDVVEIAVDAPNHFQLSTSANSAAVAGVITTRPGVLMNTGVEDVGDAPGLALAGRVPVKISDEGGAIRPGDLLVSSSTPGYAMKAPANPAIGTIIGKALQPHTQGLAMIEMLVMLR